MVNWSDPNDVEKFKQTARARGFDETEIETYVAENGGVSAAPKLPELKLSTMGDLELPKQAVPEEVITPSASPTPSPTPVTAQVTPSGEIIITQKFGNPNAKLYGRNKSGRANINRGVDLAADPDELQYAPGEGKWIVEDAYTGNDFNTGWGRSVVLKNADTGEKIRRSHLNKVMVTPGQEVTGKEIGTTGRTGRTTGYHKDVEYLLPNGQLSDYAKSKYFKYER
jgi:murein DD-endopeptidase MepM/ murein hydrolase activator NlpD